MNLNTSYVRLIWIREACDLEKRLRSLHMAQSARGQESHHTTFDLITSERRSLTAIMGMEYADSRHTNSYR